MAANKLVTIGPTALTTTTSTTLVNPGSISGATVIPVGFKTTLTNLTCTIRHLRLVNTSASATTVSLFVGAAAANTAGTEFLGSALSIAGNSFTEWFGSLRLASGDVAAALCGGGKSVV